MPKKTITLRLNEEMYELIIQAAKLNYYPISVWCVTALWDKLEKTKFPKPPKPPKEPKIRKPKLPKFKVKRVGVCRICALNGNIKDALLNKDDLCQSCFITITKEATNV